MKKLVRLVVLLVAVWSALIFIVQAQTQSTTGVIQGTVLDEAGAVIPGANIEVKNTDNNITRNLVTDADGRFVFLQLQPGRYTLTVSKQGYATLEQQNLSLTVGQAINLNLSVKVSNVQERITITASPTIDTVKTESSSTLNEVAISNTPVLGRKFEDLLTLTPGVSITQGPDGDEINFNGQRGIFNNINLDGGDYNNGFFGEQVGGQRAAIDISMEAIKEFQVVATGASAEFGRSAGGTVNVITKSGTNELRGSAFHFQRLEALSSTPKASPDFLKDFRREQFGGTIGGPIVRDKAFFFGSFEQITGTLTRPNLSVPIGTPCSVQNPTIQANEALIAGSADCQRLALLNFMRTTRNQDEGQPLKKPINTSAFLGKLDWKLSPANDLAFSYNFNRSKKENETFDVATYGNSANGTEGPGKINVFNLNLFTTLSETKLNEFHFTYNREDRPRSSNDSNIPADTAMGFDTAFRFGRPFFLAPNIDELFQRYQFKDNFSIVSGKHTFKFGGDWTHSKNAQVFRGFFLGRYIFDSVTGFLRYASPAAATGFGPNAGRCNNGTWTTIGGVACSDGSSPTTPLLLYLQGAGLTGPATDAAGASDIDNEEFALFAQDKWQVTSGFTLNYGLRWEAQLLAEPSIPVSQTAYASLLNNPRFPSDGTLPDQKKMFQPRVGFAWDINRNSKSVLRASSGIYFARQNMLSQVGSITTNGVQQQTIAGGLFANPTVRPTWPNVAPVTPVPSGQFPLFTGIRVFSRDYANPRLYSTNVQFEREIVQDLALYIDFTHAKGVHLTRFLNANQNGIFSPQFGEVAVTSSVGKSLYRGVTIGMRKRYSKGYQLEWNYVYSKDLDDDSNERDPFSFRYADINNLQLDYALADRDIRHKFNFIANGQLFWGIEGNARIQARSAQPITLNVRTPQNPARNTTRKDNEFFSFDWRITRPFRFGSNERFAVTPLLEMFNTFNNKNLVNPLTTPGLFNFDGFLRQGFGDPRQLQLAVKFTF